MYNIYQNFEVNRYKQLYDKPMQRERLLEWKRKIEYRANNSEIINMRNYMERNKINNTRLSLDTIKSQIYTKLEKVKNTEKYLINSM